MFIHFQNKKNI